MVNDLMTHPIEYQANGQLVKLSGSMVKQYLIRGEGNVSDQEIVMFLNLCKFQQLNPFLNEAYLVKFGDRPAQIITSKEAFMKRAEANEHYAGLEAGIIVERDGKIENIEGAVKLPTDKLLGGWARVFRDDRKVPIKVQISFNEFSKGQSTWKTMPMTMIRKTAIVNAMREAFPGNLGSMYTEEEAPETSRKDITQAVDQEIHQKAHQEIIDVQPEPVPEKTKTKSNPKQQPRTEPLDDPAAAFEQESMTGPGF